MLATLISLRLLGSIAGAALYGFLAVLLAAKRDAGPRDRLALAIAAAGGLLYFAGSLSLFGAITTGREVSSSAWLTGVVWLGLAPGAGFAWLVYRHHAFGLSIRRRVITGIGLSLVTAIYLFLVRNVARYAEVEVEAYGRLVELALIMAAAVLWLPLYDWLARRQYRRVNFYADFSKRLAEESARILELERQLELTVERVGQAFRLRKALLVASGARSVSAGFQTGGSALTGDELERLEHDIRGHALDFLRDQGAAFNYVFPLRYENRLVGLLLADTAPRVFLDEEDELLLVTLGRQIAHSIQTCRMVEDKIALETALLRQEHLATIGTLAATIAHEVKNPLSAIKTLVQVMAESPDLEERQQRDLAFIRAEIDRLGSCVEQLLSYARPVGRESVKIPLAGLLESTAGLLSRDHQDRGIRVEWRVAPGLERTQVDYQAVQQVVLNLALNAVQASSSGECVSIEAAGGPDGALAISVTDQGPGIPPEAQETIFEPFFTTKPKGTGLGLAIVKKNVQRLGGRIHVASPLANGRGARVTVHIPLP